ncbi:MAG: cupin domain-containing protein [Acidobacteriia bacterium]|nr:cupin domain-containing protein [Terriglobia bacterium]
MRRASWSIFALAVLPLAAQDVRFETPEVRVIEATISPGQRSAPHQHATNRVMIYLDDGQMTLTHSGGEVEELRWKAGDVRWSPSGGLHTSDNTGSTTYRIVELELKNGPGALPSSPLDPVRVDPRRYEVEFENPQVRVLRARYGPHEAGAIHEHILNRVTVFLTGQHMKVTAPDGKAVELNGKAGDVRLGGPARHQEENLSPLPFEVIAVELKR